MAVARHRQGADLVLRRSARRQPGARSSRWASSARTACSTCWSSMGFKEIEVAFPSASQTDFDFVRSIIEGEPDPRRRRDPGADAVPAGIDRAHVRGGEGREAGHPAFLQFDLDLAARRRVPHRPQGRQRDRGQRPRDRSRRSPAKAPETEFIFRIFARELHRHRARFRARNLRGGQGRHPADAARIG